MRQLLAQGNVTSQKQLADALAEAGFSVTQATVSRDLDALGAVRAKSDGSLVSAAGGSPLSLVFSSRYQSVAVSVPDGVVICSFFQTIWYERGRVCEVKTVRSTDNAQTWETPVHVPAP